MHHKRTRQTALLIACLLALSLLVGCSDADVDLLQSAGHDFLLVNHVKIIERDRDTDTQTTIGVVSDIHGDEVQAQKIATYFLQAEAEYIFILGDSVHNEHLRDGPQREDAQELAAILTIFAQTELPVFVMPGNHEGKEAYLQGLESVQRDHPNVIDLVQYRIIDLDDAAFIAVPGYHDIAYLPQNGYRYGLSDLQFIPDVAAPLHHPILLSHGPPRTQTNDSIDSVPGVGNVGDPQLSLLMKQAQLNISISGHIHEAGKRAVDASGAAVDTDATLRQAWINIAAGEEGHAAVLSIEEGQVRIFWMDESMSGYP